MSTVRTINNSTVVRMGQHRMDFNKFTDLNSLYSLFKKDSFTTYKGIIHLWNQYRVMHTPLLKEIEQKQATMWTNGPEGKWRYSIPYELDPPFIVDDDLTRDIDKPGLDGSAFPIRLSEDAFTNTDIITYDLWRGLTLRIMPDIEVREDNGSWVYMVECPQTHIKPGLYFPKQFLRPGIPYVKISNVNGEFSTQKSSISTRRVGYMDLEGQAGGHRSIEHWITAYADMVEIDSNVESRYKDKLPFGPDSPKGVTWFMNYSNTTGKAIPSSLHWIDTVEMLLRAEMAEMEERDITWNKGGYATDGRRKVRINLGLIEQMKQGHHYTYIRLTLDLIESAVNQLFRGRTDIPAESRRTKIYVGTVALLELSKLLAEDFRQNNPFVVNAGDVKGFLTGDAMHLGYGLRFTTKRFPIGGEIEFVHFPSFDSFTGMRLQDGLLANYPHSSANMAIFDITDSRFTNAAAKFDKTQFRVPSGFNENANIFIVKPRNWDYLMWGYKLGSHQPASLGKVQGMYSGAQGDRDGYGIWMKSFSSIWLADASRCVLFEKSRPDFIRWY